ncbi:MAG: TMEM175 family protein [Henriciella sp.]|jgi:hypothetical protein|nr:TMEM175 family protein [Henriciella sp.]
MRETVAKHLDHDPEFEWRGQNVTRIENLSDIVFALALGMLLLTGTPPQTFSELITFLLGIIPVTAGFAILLLIWNQHFVFFRRYGLADNTVVFLNSALLLVVLFLAYPLRFIFDSLFGFILASMTGDFTSLLANEMDYRNSSIGVGIFGGGYAVLFTIVSLLYSHALKKADMLGLDEDERILTKRSIWIQRSEVVVAMLVCVCALFTPMGAFAGGIMFLNWPAAVFFQIKFKPTKIGPGSAT